MKEIKIYKFKDIEYYVLESTLPGNPKYKKYYLLNLINPQEERVSFIFPFVINDIGDFRKGTPYKEIKKDERAYSEILKKANRLAGTRIENYRRNKEELNRKGELTDIETESTINAVNTFYSDLITQ